MGFFRSLAGSVRLELTSADKESALRDIGELGIEILGAEPVNELTVRFTVSRSDLRTVEATARRKGEKLHILEHSGLFWPLWGLRRRVVLLSGLTIMLMMSLALPGRVLFVQVEGNRQIPTRLILEAAQDAGIRFGASRRTVRSEKMKNTLLGALPQLQWAGVNTYGCTAVISVRERAEEMKLPRNAGVSNIIAACDGVITSCTVTDGNALCRAGQAVQKGQVLISGYVDNGLTVTATRAAGEIFAQTQHEVTAVTPSQALKRGAKTFLKQNFSVVVGKKRINFKKGSGIYEGTCVKMCTEYHLTLPGGYRLPVMLVVETVTGFDVQAQPFSEPAMQKLLSDFGKSYLRRQRVALTVLDAQEVFQADDGAYRMLAKYACTEMIGREQSEQIGDFHGKTD